MGNYLLKSGRWLLRFCCRYGSEPLHWAAAWRVPITISFLCPRRFIEEHHSGLDFGATRRTEKSPIFSRVWSSWMPPLLHTFNFSILSCCSLRSVARTNSLSYETVRLCKLILEFLTKRTGVPLQSGLAEVLSLGGTCCCRKSVFFPSSSSFLLCQILTYVWSYSEEI